ncbi:WXG100 family type VII secretion target [Pseudarthrobacter sp. NPDC058329]|uniref:WXG100 family type VII secretion target n=1 Tax=Pseudarthrobacter sp. NPDC058329 TaxID=3346448 RepID=UPI0036DDE14F
MAGNLWGADVAGLRTLAKQFGKASDTLIQQSALLSNQINNNPSWKGQDAASFRADWNGTHRAFIQQTASALKQESTRLLANADEQEKASNGAPGSGIGPFPGGSGPGSKENPWGPDWLAKGSPFRDVWGFRGVGKAALDLPKNVFGLSTMASKGMDNFTDAARWAKLPANSVTYNLLDSGTDLLGLKNLHKYVPALNQFGGVFKESEWLFKGQGPVLEGLGKGGLGRGLGWAGVGLNAFDAARYLAEGKTGDFAWSSAKAALGVACFLPPPVGIVCTAASAAITIYEIPAVKEFVNGAASNVADSVTRAVKDPGKFVEDTGKNLADLGKGAANFLGFG